MFKTDSSDCVTTRPKLLVHQCSELRAKELCESPGGCPGLPVPNSPDGLCGRKATLKNRVQELCESRGGRSGLPVSNSL